MVPDLEILYDVLCLTNLFRNRDGEKKEKQIKDGVRTKIGGKDGLQGWR